MPAPKTRAYPSQVTGRRMPPRLIRVKLKYQQRRFRIIRASIRVGKLRYYYPGRSAFESQQWPPTGTQALNRSTFRVFHVRSRPPNRDRPTADAYVRPASAAPQNVRAGARIRVAGDQLARGAQAPGRALALDSLTLSETAPSSARFAARHSESSPKPGQCQTLTPCRAVPQSSESARLRAGCKPAPPPQYQGRRARAGCHRQLLVLQAGRGEFLRRGGTRPSGPRGSESATCVGGPAAAAVDSRLCSGGRVGSGGTWRLSPSHDLRR